MSDFINSLNIDTPTYKKEVKKWIKNGEIIGLIIKETMTKKEAEKRYGIVVINMEN